MSVIEIVGGGHPAGRLGRHHPPHPDAAHPRQGLAGAINGGVGGANKHA